MMLRDITEVARGTADACEMDKHLGLIKAVYYIVCIIILILYMMYEFQP